MIALLAIATLVSAPFAMALAGNPIIRRMALRYPRRRPVEALLVVLGSLLGTAIITGSLVVGDAIDRSIKASAYEQLGPIDEVITVPGIADGRAFADRYGSLAAYPAAGDVLDGVMTMVTAPVAAVGRRAQPRAQLIELDFAAAASFGGDPAATGISGDAPPPGHAVITRDLAATTGTAPGDTLTLFAYGTSVPVVVDHVVDRTGVAGYWTIDGRQQSYNVIVAAGTITSTVGEEVATASTEPPHTLIAYSNNGDVEKGAELTDDAVAAIEAVVGPDRSVQTVKRELLTRAETTASSLSQLYVTMGLFSVAAGVLLLVNIFVMLADERRSQLGMLRALGMRRLSLVVAFATEGWLYALVSSAVGAVLGIQLGRFITVRADQVLAADYDQYALDLTFAYDRTTVVRGFAIGLMIAVATVVATSVRISRLNVIAAIRELPIRRRLRPARRLVPAMAAMALGAALTAIGLVGPQSYSLAAGPALFTVGLAVATVGRLGSRATVTWSAIVVLGWGILIVPLLGWLDISTEIPIFVVQGFTMCGAGVALLTVHQKALGLWLSARAGGSIPVRIGLAYPLARTARTALSLGMFAIVVLTIVYLSFISLMVRQQVGRITADLSGGFGVVVDSNPTNPVTAEMLASVEGVTAIAPLGYGITQTSRAERSDVWPVTGFGPELVASPPALRNRGDYPTDQAAWADVLADPTLVIVDELHLATGGPVDRPPRIGDIVTLTDQTTGATRQLTVAALAEDDYLLGGTYYGQTGFSELFGAQVVPSRFFVGGNDPGPLADAIATRFVANGAEATAVSDTVEAIMAQSTGFFELMQQFVGVGLLVGIAGLGVVMVRSVRERRRDIGVLRAIGLPSRLVSRAFVIEAVFIATEGVLVGIAIALVGTYGLVLNGTGFMAGMRWSVPWRSIAVVAGLTIAAAVVTSLAPSRQAGRIRPAEALRLAD